ncbi:VWA domain-containing protein [Oceanicoccus sp. KOV_DT_Chl]|uniref:VWA domain-containing protein n=1 Tax=Oceanicoccus sp. KOV_DT_Chl TaxID=1904639 RepID=UPI000C7E62A9|nr:VWA domain-containing protein [Oceanicoccus sp. KOV_DT_Chl]
MTLPFLEQFHFLRPLWLLAIIPACILAYFFWQQKSSAVNWRGAISQQLLSYLVDGGSSRISRWPWVILLLAWVISAIALAGPTWQKLPQPIHQRQDALVIVLDLSLSMLAEDIKPSRLIRARHKILDILEQRNEGLTALIAYSGDAHIVSPLTDDNPTIANLTPALSPGMMPVFGSNPVAALRLAKQLFKNAGVSTGRVLLITDGITNNDLDELDNHLSQAGIRLSIMGVATTDGAPIPASDGFLKDNSGNIIVPQLLRQPLEQLAKRNGGRYTDVSLADNDIQFLLPANTSETDETTILTEREFDQWHDRGPLLAILLLPIALFAFRRGWLLTLPLLLLLDPQSSVADEQAASLPEQLQQQWQNLWLRPDQQAAKSLAAGDPKTAAQQFENPQWQGSALYQAGDFTQAAKSFAKNSSANDHYNRGNALAKAGQLDEAITAYEKALEQQPEMEDAIANKALLEQLKEQQEQQQKDQQQSDEDNSEQEQSDQQSEQQSPDQSSEQQSGEDSEQQDQSQDGQQQEDNSQPSPDSNSDNQQQADSESQSADEKNDEQEQNKQQQSESTDSKEQQEKQQAQQAQAEPQELDPEEKQKQQAMEQWLRKIPDDPSGLLRRKFNYEYRLRQQQGDTERDQPQW